MKPLAPDTVLQDRYQITRLIGKGGMGEVYLAVDTRLGHSVALKRTTVGDDAVLAEAFEQEGRTLAQLRHPVLPKVSDHFLENGEQYLVMDYIEGSDLAKKLKSVGKPFPLNWVLFWADQLLEALTYLHNHKPPIIHRDIKPQNLKLTAENQVTLLDFGLSKRSLGDTKVTSSGSVVGYTPHYAPMEQIRGTGTNAASDIYSLSATLYQLLTATVPPDALTRADAMIGGRPDPIQPLMLLNSEISELLSSIIIKGMHISQDQRYASARDMQKELRKAFNQLQESMSAETVAFNVADLSEESADSPMEAVSVPPPVDATAPNETVISGVDSGEEHENALPLEQDFSGDKTEVIDASSIRGIASDVEYDSTLKKNFYPDQVVEEPEILKTEAFSADEVSQEYATKEDYEIGSENLDSEEPDTADAAQPEFEADATVPLIVMEESLHHEDSKDEELESVDFSASKTPAGSADAASVPAAAAKKNSSTGKYIAILGGLGVLLFLVIGSALAIGWYVTSGGGTTAEDDTNVSVPSPEPSVEETPIEEITPEPDNTNIASENTNTESNTGGAETSNIDTNTETTTTTKTTTGSKPRTTSTPVRNSTPVSKPTARPTKPVVKPTSQPTAKPTKPKSKDPGILQ